MSRRRRPLAVTPWRRHSKTSIAGRPRRVPLGKKSPREKVAAPTKDRLDLLSGLDGIDSRSAPLHPILLVNLTEKEARQINLITWRLLEQPNMDHLHPDETVRDHYARLGLQIGRRRAAFVAKHELAKRAIRAVLGDAAADRLAGADFIYRVVNRPPVVRIADEGSTLPTLNACVDWKRRQSVG